jgi:hypothetical protein
LAFELQLPPVMSGVILAAAPGATVAAPAAGAKPATVAAAAPVNTVATRKDLFISSVLSYGLFPGQAGRCGISVLQ